jgi:hypothetical protein
VPGRTTEKRQFGRIQLDRPLRGSLDEYPVWVVEVSVAGFLVEHNMRIAPAATRTIRVQWNEKTMEFGCAVARSTVVRLARNASETSIYRSGIQILKSTGDSDRILRDFIAERVIRALNEQKANARGVPPLAAYSYQVGKGDRFRRCEFVDGAWRNSETTSSEQPANGFAIAADTEASQVDLLCQTYEKTTTEGRRLTRILAELSISRQEGTPTRRYEP